MNSRDIWAHPWNRRLVKMILAGHQKTNPPACQHCGREIAGSLQKRPCKRCPWEVRQAYEGAEK